MKTVNEIAREAGVITNSPYLMPHDHVLRGIERFAALVRADEREAVCDIVDYELDSNGHAEAIKIAIRARGETK